VLALGLIVAGITFAASCDQRSFVAATVRPTQVTRSVAAAQAHPSILRPAASAWPAAMLATVAIAAAAMRSTPSRVPRAQVVITRCLPNVSPMPQVSTQLTTVTPPMPEWNEDLISFEMAEGTSAAEQANAPQSSAPVHSPRPRPRRSRPSRQARARREHRRIGSRLVQRDYLSHASLPSFEPSKVPLVLQEAMQHGPRPRTASGRESKPLVEAPGLSASLDIGLKSFNVERTANDSNHP
ncbi:unnamed protein product, partial [Symbiodinium natans]